LIEAELTKAIGARAARADRGPHQPAQRASQQDLSTTSGNLELRIPKPRTGPFFPSLLERLRRVDQAVGAVTLHTSCHLLILVE